MVATRSKITIFTLSPVRDVQTAVIPCLGTGTLPLLCITQDRLAFVSGKVVVCFSLSGQKMYQYPITKVKNIRCLTFDPLKNLYCGLTTSGQGCNEYCDQYVWGICSKCHQLQTEHKDMNGVFQIMSVRNKGRWFITEYLNAKCLFFDEYSEQLVVSDGNKCTVYRLCM